MLADVPGERRPADRTGDGPPADLTSDGPPAGQPVRGLPADLTSDGPPAGQRVRGVTLAYLGVPVAGIVPPLAVYLVSWRRSAFVRGHAA